MRKTMIVPVLAAAMLAVPMVAVAQDAQPRVKAETVRGGERGMMMQRFAAELNLTEAQQAEMRQIRQRLQAQNAPLVAQLREAGVMRHGAAARGERPMHRGQMGTEQRAQMRERMQNMTPEQRAQMRERMQNMTPEQRAQMRERTQSMTPEQRAQMRDQMQQRRQAGEQGQRQRAQGERGARAQRQIPAELRPVVEQMRQNNRAAQAEMRAVLTAEQQARLAELRQQRRGHHPAR
jgi:Spy/CpxP family protein refolding chaperone